MDILCRSGALIASLLVTGHAQSGPSGAPAFDVVSVKPSGSTFARLAANESVTFTSQGFRYSKGRLTCNQPLKGFIQEAYSIPKDWQLTGPDWINFEKYDFQATMPPETPREIVRQMLQTMLAERFGLKVHREPKVMPVYALVISSGGPKLTEVEKPSDHSSASGAGYLSASATTIQSLADTLSHMADRPVIDATEIKGRYKIDLHWAPDFDTVASGEARKDKGILNVLEAQLGLKLQARKMPVEILVIDHIERTPTRN
jgi:uncharacterized protein (TIGR03435 family)